MPLCARSPVRRPSDVAAAHAGPITSIAFTSLGDFMCSGDETGVACLWCVRFFAFSRVVRKRHTGGARHRVMERDVWDASAVGALPRLLRRWVAATGAITHALFVPRSWEPHRTLAMVRRAARRPPRQRGHTTQVPTMAVETELAPLATAGPNAFAKPRAASRSNGSFTAGSTVRESRAGAGFGGGSPGSLAGSASVAGFAPGASRATRERATGGLGDLSARRSANMSCVRAARIRFFSFFLAHACHI